MPVNLKTIKDKVKHLLETDPEARNSDLHLIQIIWKEECRDLHIGDLESFFCAFTSGRLTNFESIRRDRQKWQETCPELRGTNYKERKEKSKVIVGDLSTLFNT